VEKSARCPAASVVRDLPAREGLSGNPVYQAVVPQRILPCYSFRASLLRSMRARHLAGLIAILSISQVPVLSDEAVHAAATYAASPESHANSTEGLKQLLLEMRSAARDDNQSKLAALVKQTEIPNCYSWLHKMYAPDKADSWMALCDPKALNIKEASLGDLFKRLANEDGQFLVRSVNDSPQPGKGLEWGWLHAVRQPLDIYWASWLPADETDESAAEPIGYFMFVDGEFRWESNISFATILRAPPVVASGGLHAPAISTKLDQRIEGTTYINGTAHFTLTVPADWHVTDALVKTTPHVVGTVAAPGGEVAIMIQRYPYVTSSEMASLGVQGAFSRGFAGYHKIDEPPITIQGENVSSFVFSFQLPSAGQSSRAGKMLVVFIEHENSVLGIMCEAPDPLFDENEDTFKKIVTSYRRTANP
jgi:hypothetical protein